MIPEGQFLGYRSWSSCRMALWILAWLVSVLSGPRPLDVGMNQGWPLVFQRLWVTYSWHVSNGHLSNIPFVNICPYHLNLPCPISQYTRFPQILRYYYCSGRGYTQELSCDSKHLNTRIIHCQLGKFVALCRWRRNVNCTLVRGRCCQ